jgi:predicted Fe-S protein YdhL (DUF1289 family)
MVESPCVKICELNAAGFCIGCGRDGAEIANWMAMSDAEKASTIETATARLKRIATNDTRCPSAIES